MGDRAAKLLGTPDKVLVTLIQRDRNDSLAFETLYGRYLDKLKAYLEKRGMSADDVEDVLSEVWMKVWKGLPNFECREDGTFRGWLYKILANSAVDHWKRWTKLERAVQLVSLDQEVELRGGSTGELAEVISLDEDPIDREQREWVIEFAEQCLHNDKQLELLRCRMRRQPLPKEWSRSLIDTYWCRLRKILLEELEGQSLMDEGTG